MALRVGHALDPIAIEMICQPILVIQLTDKWAPGETPTARVPDGGVQS